jgi:type 1 glutamine amidotransferase
MVNFLPTAAGHVITEGISDFEINTEQYWVLSDPYIDVLATTIQRIPAWATWDRELSFPVIFTRNWGKGKIFVSTLGHRVEILAHPSVNTMIKRGLLWVSR